MTSPKISIITRNGDLAVLLLIFSARFRGSGDLVLCPLTHGYSLRTLRVRDPGTTLAPSLRMGATAQDAALNNPVRKAYHRTLEGHLRRGCVGIIQIVGCCGVHRVGKKKITQRTDDALRRVGGVDIQRTRGKD